MLRVEWHDNQNEVGQLLPVLGIEWHHLMRFGRRCRKLRRGAFCETWSCLPETFCYAQFMTAPLEFEHLLAPVTGLGEVDALRSWRWLLPPKSIPVLMTALGDMFIQVDEGPIHFLDSYEGTLKPAGEDYPDFKLALADERKLALWFLPDLVCALRESGLVLGKDQCYSPIVHTLVGGNMEPSNFQAVPWKVHFFPLGQLVEQIAKLPPGTKIDGIDIEWK